MMEWILGVLLILVLVQEARLAMMRKANKEIPVNKALYNTSLQEMQKSVLDAQNELGEEREKNRILLSQKKSSETRLGQISEHLIPFLEGCPYDPKNLHFLGNPIDFISFDFDAGEIVFIEVKSGNSKPSKRQKIIKNIIKSGRINYAEIRVNEKGVKHKLVTGERAELEDDDGKTETEN